MWIPRERECESETDKHRRGLWPSFLETIYGEGALKPWMHHDFRAQWWEYVCVCVHLRASVCLQALHVRTCSLVEAQHKKHDLEYLYSLISTSERASA